MPKLRTQSSSIPKKMKMVLLKPIFLIILIGSLQFSSVTSANLVESRSSSQGK